MDAKILRKWGLKASDSKDSLPSSPVSQSSRDTRSGTPVDVRGLQAWLPPIPPFERQRLSADVEQDLRYACAVILKDTTPDDADLDQTDPLEEYRKTVARAEKKEQTTDANVDQRTHKPRKDSPRASGYRQSSKTNHHGSNAPLQASSRDASSRDQLQSLDSVAAFPHPPRREPYKSKSLTNQDNYRPPPHKAASSDYVVAHESSRTSTTNPDSAATRSARDTAITSFSQSPHDTMRSANHRSIGYPSAQGGQREALPIRPGSSSHANASHTVWVTGGRTQKEHEDAVAPPVLRKAESRSSLRSQNGLRSRAESIRDGIKEYIRPGSSRGSLSRPGTARSNERPTFSAAPAAATSRPESRASRSSASAENKRSWWKGGGLRRKGSFTASRNSMGSNAGQEPMSPAGNGGPDLDKSLPPMPSLDSYVEPPKEPKLHISQLMVPVPPPSSSPAVPQNSLASPAPLSSPGAGLRSPSSFHTAQNSPLPPETPQYVTAPPRSNTGRSAHSPALTPGGRTSSQPRQVEQRPKSSKSRPQTTSRRRPDVNKVEPGYKTEQPANHAWRDELIQKEEERRLKRERDRHLAREQKKRMIEAQERQQANGTRNGKDKDSAGLKNRLSRMFGKSNNRSQVASNTEAVVEVAEPIEGHGKGTEIIAN